MKVSVQVTVLVSRAAAMCDATGADDDDDELAVSCRFFWDMNIMRQLWRQETAMKDYS
jgi:hypothetical protein